MGATSLVQGPSHSAKIRTVFSYGEATGGVVVGTVDDRGLLGLARATSTTVSPVAALLRLGSGPTARSTSNGGQSDKSTGASRPSPDGSLLAAVCDNVLSLWQVAQPLVRAYSPFRRIATARPSAATIRRIIWSPCSRRLLVISADGAVRLYEAPTNVHTEESLEKAGTPSLTPTAVFVGHRSPVASAFFLRAADGSLVDAGAELVATLGTDGALFVWSLPPPQQLHPETGVPLAEPDDGDDNDDGRRPVVRLAQYTLGGSTSRVTCVAFSTATHALVTGHRSGEFCVYDASRIAARFGRGLAAEADADSDDVSLVHTMSLGNATVTAAAFCASGEWIALGVARLGAYVVWEWRTESFILKQQGHAVGYTVRSISHSPDGQVLTSGGEDGKVKVWSATSGQCFVTFAEHSSAVTAVRFSPRGHVVFSASLDGTVRAFDLVRYRNFRTFTTPGSSSEQLTCLAVDGSGDIVAAGSSSSFSFFVWSVKSGACTDVLSGHTGPVSDLSFGGTDQSLATVSWDGTLRVWNLFGRGGASSSEAYSHAAGGRVGDATSDGTVLAVTWRPDGKQLATATLNGQLYLWAPAEGILEGLIDGAADLSGAPDGIARRGQDASHFSTISYSPDGTFLLAAGLTKFVCMYSVETRTLLARWQLSTNPALLGVLDRFNESTALRDADGARWASLRVSDDEDDEEDGGEGTARASRFAMPGVKSGPHAEAAARGKVAAEAVAMRCAAVEFAPTGATFAAATPEGIQIYGRGARRTFDPIAVDEATTPAAARAAAAEGRFGEAWEAALRLRAPKLLISLLPAAPVAQVPLVVSQLPRELLPSFMSTLASSLDSRTTTDEGAAPSRHLELVLLILAAVMREHGATIRGDPLAFAGPLRQVRRALADPLDQLHSLVTENTAEIRYVKQHVAE
eukprot:CAMPEP_0170738130 /NCGR_PEP_ID=MMETSP0437-20130122/4489_1 /TAXON_ID=0 /ORGANISM="Sexangularia sp." /LENGTH=914 /DNA_ID=CAMNT_0011076549 /DNA_START=232 /DNA_END=2976 /DNA_ORIENTATION=-